MAWLMKDPEVVYTDLEEGAVLLHLGTKFYYSLNGTGQSIWRLLDSANDFEHLIDGLSREYDVDEEQAKPVVLKFLDLLQKQLLVLPNSTQLHREGQIDVNAAPMEAPAARKKPFTEPELLKHDEPLHDVAMSPFDPQLPLAE